MTSTKFISDHKVATAINHIVEKSQQTLDLVTPFWDWRNLTRQVADTHKRGVFVRVLLKFDQRDEGNQYNLIFDFDTIGVEVYTISGLHAKIVVNEKACIVGSMNFLATSATSSHEAAIYTNDPALLKDCKDYTNYLFSIATQQKVSLREKLITKALSILPSFGKCIVCGKRIGFDPNLPFCSKDQPTGSKFDAIGKYCHDCGKEVSTSKYRPLCIDCWKKNKETGLEDQVLG